MLQHTPTAQESGAGAVSAPAPVPEAVPEAEPAREAPLVAPAEPVASFARLTPAGQSPAQPGQDGERDGETDGGQRVVRGIVTVPADDPFLEGHYPGFPLVPGLSLVQYAYDLVAGAAAPEHSTVVLKKARFLSPVRPGEELVIEARLEQGADGLRARASVSADHRPAAEIALHYPQETP